MVVRNKELVLYMDMMKEAVEVDRMTCSLRRRLYDASLTQLLNVMTKETIGANNRYHIQSLTVKFVVLASSSAV